MAESKLVLDDSAVDEIRKLKDGFFRQLLDKLVTIVSARDPDEDGKLRITQEDVRLAVREVAEDPEIWESIQLATASAGPAKTR